MAVSRHLEYYRTANSAVRSADRENPSLEPDVEWIGCTVCEIFAFELYYDLETGSGSLKVIESGTMRSADRENLILEPDMEWIGRTVCEIFAFKLYCDLETGVRGHSRSSKIAQFDRAHTTLYSSAIVTTPLSLTVSEI